MQIVEISDPWLNDKGEIVFIELLVVGWDCPRMGAGPFKVL
jgi:hypothetical protein